MSYFAFLNLGNLDLILILVIVILVFGGKKIPELSRSINTSIRERSKGMSDFGDEQTRKKIEDDTRHETPS